MEKNGFRALRRRIFGPKGQEVRGEWPHSLHFNKYWIEQLEEEEMELACSMNDINRNLVQNPSRKP
jgi:hypothetical protein